MRHPVLYVAGGLR